MKVLAPLMSAALVMGGAAMAMPVTPNFTSGTIMSETNATTTISEVIRQRDYSNGYTYVVTGANVQANNQGPVPTPGPVSLPVTGNGTTAVATPVCAANAGNLCYGTTFSVINQNAPFQLSETYLGPGIFQETDINRTTTVISNTKSISVFTQ